MTQTMRMLRSEHRNIASLLELLERQVHLLEKNRDPDLRLIIEIVDFFRSFPDLHHHPQEDLVLRRLRRRAEGLDGRFFGLDGDHDRRALQPLQFADPAVRHRRAEE